MGAAVDKVVVIGRVAASYGVEGWLKIHSFTEPQQNIIHYFPWLINIHGHWQDADILAHRFHHGQIIINLAGCYNRTYTHNLHHSEIGIYRKQLPVLAQGDYYWSDLEGLTVINQANHTLGVISHMLATGANDVMVVKGEKEHLIPFMLNKFVTAVDFERRHIKVDWDPGMYDEP